MKSMENSAKDSLVIAVTSQNYRTVTKHAGLCRKLLVYNVKYNEDEKNPVDINEIERIRVSKEEALHTCKPEADHPVDVANVLICGSCGEGFIRKMEGRDIIVSVATKDDPIEAIKEYLGNKERHYTCDGSHQTMAKRHRNCTQNKKHKHQHEHHHGDGNRGCHGHGHDHGNKGGCSDKD